MKTLTVVALLVSSLSLAAADATKLPGPLFDGLGNHHHPVTTRSKAAQRYFDQGIILLFAFNHKEAIRSFQSAAKIDPDCAMAWWGVAYANGPHVNKPMFKEDTAAAWEALKLALAVKAKGSPREQAYINALAKRYQAEHVEDRSALDKAFAAAMRELVKEYPDDLDAQTFFAESLMDTMPWDYWLKDRSPKPETEEAFAALKLVIARNPDHPGANHFYIHAVEAGPNPQWGLPAADRLASFAPSAGHLVHMPAHIYMRVGQYNDAVVANDRAAKADRKFINNTVAQGFYPGAYYPHNLHFLWQALMFEGRSKEAMKAAVKVSDYATENYCGPKKALEGPRQRHLPQLTAVRFGRWDQVLTAPKPSETNDFLVDRAMWHFCRGMAYTARQQPDDAARELKELSKFARSEDAKKIDSPQFPATSMLVIAEHLLTGKLAGTRGDTKAMIAELEKAVAAEDTLPYMEPGYWPYSTRPTLAAALLQSGEAAKAEQVFRDDLARWPRNGWALFGLEKCLRAQQKDELANVVQRQLTEAWKRADINLDLAAF